VVLGAGAAAIGANHEHVEDLAAAAAAAGHECSAPPWASSATTSR